MLIKDLLLEGKKKLCRLSTADLDAEVLLAHVLGMRREDILRDSDSLEVEDVDMEVFLRYCDEVVSGRPVAYITGLKEFYGLDFHVDERVLIPRPETEMIVDEVLGFLKGWAEDGRQEEIQLLDVGTGSMNIATAIVKGHGHVFAHAVDISEDALEIARMNRELHDLGTHVQLYQSDLLESVDERNFDVIVANLPYISEGDDKILDKNVEKFEPSGALFGGADGLELYKKLIQQILDKKVDFNLLVGEIGSGQEDSVRAMLSNFFEQENGVTWEIKDDLAGIPRIFVVKKS